jgi:phosphomevalonate kinase
MSGEVMASAPGKVLLSGEYAVLDGAPAICMAVNRRACVKVADRRGDLSEVRAPGYSEDVGRFVATEHGIDWQDAPKSFRVVDSVFRAVELQPSGARVINLNTSEFIDPATRRKIGIGSSAAITVALCAAINNTADVASLAMVAQRAHADLQEGAGSGADVACSLTGGLIEYRMEGASVAPLRWPDGLSYRLIWTGVAASTRDKLSKLAAGISKPSRVRLAGASENMAAAWCTSDARQIIAGYREYCDLLREFSIDHDLGIFDAGHDELWHAANAAGLTYKPCGAGGGDVGILLASDTAALDTFTATQSTKFIVLDCEMSLTGVRIDA